MMKTLKHLKLYENFDNNNNLIVIKANTEAVVLDDLSDLKIGKLCINKAKQETNLITGDIYVLTILKGFSTGYNMYRYNNEEVSNTTQEEYQNVLTANNIQTLRDLERFPIINIDLYGGGGGRRNAIGF